MTRGPGVVFLISRPVPAYRAAAAHAGLGDTLFEPPLTFEFPGFDTAELSGAAGFLFSSQTAVESIQAQEQAQARALKQIACWAIGSATSQAASNAGMRVQHHVDGGGAKFVDAFDDGQFTLPKSGLIWPTVPEPAFDLDTALGQRGLAVQRLVTYRATPRTQPRALARAWIDKHPSAAVALFSHQCTLAFLAWRATTLVHWQPRVIFAMAPRVIKALPPDLRIPILYPKIASRDSFTKMLNTYSDAA